jgi:hypothetical protein
MTRRRLNDIKSIQIMKKDPNTSCVERDVSVGANEIRRGRIERGAFWALGKWQKWQNPTLRSTILQAPRWFQNGWRKRLLLGQPFDSRGWDVTDA